MACTLSLKPKTYATNVLETECSNCGDCVVACKKMGKALSFEAPLIKSLSPNLRTVRKYVCRTLAVAVVGGLGFLVYSQVDFSSGPPAIKNKLLSNKRIVVNSDKIGSLDLLANGAVIARGGEWSLNGSANWQWQPQGEQGSFRIIPDVNQPESYSIAQIDGDFKIGGTIRFEHHEAEARLAEDFPNESYQIMELNDIPKSSDTEFASMEGRVVLYQYANQVYVLNLWVKDPVGIIKKIETEGKHIGMETMLTNVKQWINSPQITVSEGTAPALPFSTRMNVIFHDGHTEEMHFETNAIVDRSSEEFDDPWF